MAVDNNPFDITTPTVSNPTLDESYKTNATTATPTVPAASGTFAKASTPDTVTSTGYDATTYSTTDWSNTTDQSVANQLQGLIAQNSPLMQQSKTNALQDMNKRGLLNSSMAIGAGQNAVIANALPIAQADAKTRAAQAEFNATAANTASANNALAQNTAAQFSASQQNEADQFNARLAAETDQFNVGQENTGIEANTRREQEAALAEFNTQSDLVKQQLVNSFDAAKTNADAETRIALQNIDALTRVELGQIESDFKQLMQTSASASELFAQALKNINDLVMNPDLSTEALNNGITTQIQNLQGGMAILDALNENVEGLKDIIAPADEEEATA
jgi:hypothetical protein